MYTFGCFFEALELKMIYAYTNFVEMRVYKNLCTQCSQCSPFYIEKSLVSTQATNAICNPYARPTYATNVNTIPHTRLHNTVFLGTHTCIPMSNRVYDGNTHMPVVI